MASPKEHFTYDQIAAALKIEGNCLVWLEKRGNRSAGAIAGTVAANGYRTVAFRGRVLQQHRVVWLLTYGSWPERSLDHINRDKTDNRASNLRLATASQNEANKASIGRVNLKGVSISNRGQYQVKCRQKFVGVFSTAEEAGKAYDQEAKKSYGEFACLNFPDQS